MSCDAGWRNYHFVKLTTSDGIVGWSEFDEGFGAPGVGAAIARLAPRVVGQAVGDHERIYAELYAITRPAAGGGCGADGLLLGAMSKSCVVLEDGGRFGAYEMAKAVAVPDRVSGDSSNGGVWHKQWDQTVQSEWIEQFYKIALSKPFVETVTYSVLSDNDGGELGGAGLLTENFEPKKSFETLGQLRKAVFKG